jgi:hypothetical protein
MAVSVTNKAGSGATGSGAALTSASFSVTSGDVLFLTTHAYKSTGSANPTAPTISVTSTSGTMPATWTLVNSVDIDITGSDRSSMFVYRALVSGNATGTVTVTYGVSMTRISLVIDEVSGVDTGGTNASNAVVQSATATAASGSTSLTVPLAAFGSANNVSYGCFGVMCAGAVTYSATGGFSVVGTGNSNSATTNPSSGTLVHAAGDFDAAGAWSGAGTLFTSGGVGIELKAAASGAIQDLGTPAVSAASSVSASVVRTRPIPVTVNAAAAVTAGVVRTRVISPTASGAATVTAAVVRTRPLAPNVSATSTVTATVGVGITFTATVNGVSTMTGTVVRTRTVAPAASGSAAVTAAVVRDRALVATVNGSSTVTATVTNGSTATATEADDLARFAVIHFYHGA